MIFSNLFLYLVFLALSVFFISTHFANPQTPTFFIAAGGSFILTILAIVLRYKQQKFCLSKTEIIFASFLLFAIVSGAFSGSLSPDWAISGFSLFVFYLVVRRTELAIGWLFVGLLFIGISQAVYGLGQYVYWLSNIASLEFRMSGSFDNPAGFAAALSVCFPFALFLMQKKEIYWKRLGGSAAVLFIVAVVLSQSRAGIIAIVIISGIWTLKALKLKWLNSWSSRTKIVGSAVLIIAILVGLYFVKKNSADGRLLIWQCSSHMIVDKPVLGHGEGGFQREYMLYQANYFRNHTVSCYSKLADIVKEPFNEYLLLLVEFGLVGGFFLGFFLFSLIREYRRNRTNETFYVMLCLAGIGVFACFSYPLCYPFVRLMAVFCAAFIMKNEATGLGIPYRLLSISKPIMLISCLGLLLVTGKMFYDDYHWNTIAQRSLAGETKKVMPDYARLYKTMNRNGLFLYNYGAELNYIGEWKRSNVLLNECANFYNDIDLQFLLADNYTQLKKYRQAEQCLLLAHQMIPNRFIPLYRLVKLYEEMGQDAKAYHLAQIIIKKPVKIFSGDILTIKSEMKELIERNGRK